jgi:hypothetical protein
VVEFCSPPSKPLVLLAETIDTYSQLIAEVKRLQEVAQRVKLEAGDASLSWLDRYQPYDGTLDKHTLARFDSISTAYSAKSGKPGLGNFYPDLSALKVQSADTGCGRVRSHFQMDRISSNHSTCAPKRLNYKRRSGKLDS